MEMVFCDCVSQKKLKVVGEREPSKKNFTIHLLKNSLLNSTKCVKTPLSSCKS